MSDNVFLDVDGSYNEPKFKKGISIVSSQVSMRLKLNIKINLKN